MGLSENGADRQNDRVVAFRRPARENTRHAGRAATDPVDAAAGLERYERSDGAEDDYRHRMAVNIAALAICVLLGAAGVWVAINIADLRRNQDCVLAGRKNCAGVSIPAGPGLRAPNLAAEEQAAPKRLLPQ